MSWHLARTSCLMLIVALAFFTLAHEQRFHEHGGSISPESDGLDEEVPCDQRRVIIWSPSSGENVDSSNLRVQVRCREHCRLRGLLAHLYINENGPLAAFSCDLEHNHDDEERVTVAISEAPAILWRVRVLSSWILEEVQHKDEGHSVTLHSFVPAPLHEHLMPQVRKLPWEGWALPLHPSLISLDKLRRWVGGRRGGPMTWQWSLHSLVTCVMPHLDYGMCRLQYMQTHDGELYVFTQQVQRFSHDDEAPVLDRPLHLNIAPFFPALKQGCCWGPVELVRIRTNTVQARCDVAVLQTAFFFAFSNPTLPISAYMGYLSLYKTMRDAFEGDIDPSRSLLIGNIAPPVESGLSLYHALYMSLTAVPIMSRSELAYSGRVCFRDLVVGMSDRPTARSDFHGARALAASAIGVDLKAAAVHVAASLAGSLPSSSPLPQLLILQRVSSLQYPLNRNWANPDMLAQVARRLGFDSRIVVSAGMSLQQIAAAFSNCSAVLGITGDDLGHVWWMGGGVLIHVRPYGYGNRSGLEYNSMAARASVAVIDVHLQPHHATIYPWRAPDSVFMDAQGYWDHSADDAYRFFSNVGDISIEDDELSSWLQEARELLQKQKRQQDEVEEDRGGASPIWSASEGEHHMLSTMARYGREFEAALQPDDFVNLKKIDLE